MFPESRGPGGNGNLSLVFVVFHLRLWWIFMRYLEGPNQANSPAATYCLEPSDRTSEGAPSGIYGRTATPFRFRRTGLYPSRRSLSLQICVPFLISIRHNVWLVNQYHDVEPRSELSLLLSSLSFAFLSPTVLLVLSTVTPCYFSCSQDQIHPL